jgi:hypothetical protein
VGGFVWTITATVSNPLENGNAAVAVSPAGSNTVMEIDVTTAEPVRGRAIRVTPSSRSVSR